MRPNLKSPYAVIRTLRLLLTGEYTLEDLAARIKRDPRTAKRYIREIRRAGFRLIEKTEEHNRKRWKARV